MANTDGYRLGMSGKRVNELLERQFVVPTLSFKPDANTKTWEDGDYVVQFRIGEFCRFKEDGEWSFYRLQDIDGESYVWVNANASELPDMSGYYSKEETDRLLDDKADASDLPNMEDYYTKENTDKLLDDKADVSSLPNMDDYYTKEEADGQIATKISQIEFPEDESIKTLSISEYDALVSDGKISDKTLYMVTSEGSPVAVYVGSVLIAQRDEGSQGFAYNFPIIF